MTDAYDPSRIAQELGLDGIEGLPDLTLPTELAAVSRPDFDAIEGRLQLMEQRVPGVETSVVLTKRVNGQTVFVNPKDLPAGSVEIFRLKADAIARCNGDVRELVRFALFLEETNKKLGRKLVQMQNDSAKAPMTINGHDRG